MMSHRDRILLNMNILTQTSWHKQEADVLANPLDDVRIDIKDNSQETPRQLIQRIRAMLNDPATSRDEISKHLKQLHQILQSHFLHTYILLYLYS